MVAIHIKPSSINMLSNHSLIWFSGSSEIPRFEYAQDPDEDEKPKCLKPTILPDIVNKKKDNVKNIVANQKKGDIFAQQETYIIEMLLRQCSPGDKQCHSFLDTFFNKEFTLQVRLNMSKHMTHLFTSLTEELSWKQSSTSQRPTLLTNFL